MIFSGGGSLPSSLLIDASSAYKQAVIPNDSMQQTCITRITGFMSADCKGVVQQNQGKHACWFFSQLIKTGPRLKLRLSRFLAVGALALFSCLPRAAVASSCVWKVTGPGGGTMYLGGSVHALRKSDYPLPAAYRSEERRV